jgi:hypothetical protein
VDTIEKTVPTVRDALKAVMDEVQSVGKDGFNKNQKYNFRGIDAVVNAVGPAFRKHGIVPVPILKDINYRDVKSAGGSPQREVTVKVCYQFVGPAGDMLDVVVPGEAMDSGDKGTAKAMSVAYRIALLQLLCIPTDDPDPDESSYERGRESFESARPAVFQPGAEAQELMAAVNAAAHQGAMDRVWARVVDAVKSGAITQDEGNWLWARYKARGPELPPDPDAAQAAAENTQATPAALEGELIEGASE